MSVARADYAGGVDIPETRTHGVDVSVHDFEGLGPADAKRRLGELSRAERIAVLFDVDPFVYHHALID